jgi:hypothetical protein
VLLAALLVVVALASRGRLGTDEAAAGPARPGLPPGAVAYFYAALLAAAAVALPCFFYVYVRETPYSKARRRRARLAPFAIVGLALLGLTIASRWGTEIREVLDNLRLWGGDPPRRPDTPTPSTPPAPEWTPMIVVSSALALGGGSLVAWRLARRRRRPSLAQTLSGVVDDTLDDLRDERDARRAIILAYARMEAALERSGVPRRESEAPLEYLARILLELEVSEAPVRALTDLFEQAKFSRHAIDATMKAGAIEALGAIRADLEELA